MSLILNIDTALEIASICLSNDGNAPLLSTEMIVQKNMLPGYRWRSRNC